METSNFNKLSFKGVVSFVNKKDTTQIKTTHSQDISIQEAFLEAAKHGLNSRRGNNSLVSALTQANIKNGPLIKIKNHGDDLQINIDQSNPKQFSASVDFISTKQNLIKFICNA